MAVNAALNTLREERRRVEAERVALAADHDLKAGDIVQWRALLGQLGTELFELGQAIGVLDQMTAGAVEGEAERQRRASVVSAARKRAWRAAEREARA